MTALRALTRGAWLRTGALLGAWILVLIEMAMMLRRDPVVDGRGYRPYGHNWPGDFMSEAIESFVEIAVLALILRPWSFQRSWIRALVSAGVFFPWSLFTAVAGMHAGSIFAAHGLWLFALATALVLIAVYAGIAAALHRFRPAVRTGDAS